MIVAQRLAVVPQVPHHADSGAHSDAGSESAFSDAGVLRVPLRHEARAAKRQPMLASSPMHQSTRASLLSSERIATQQQSGASRSRSPWLHPLAAHSREACGRMLDSRTPRPQPTYSRSISGCSHLQSLALLSRMARAWPAACKSLRAEVLRYVAVTAHVTFNRKNTSAQSLLMSHWTSPPTLADSSVATGHLVNVRIVLNI